MATDPVLNPEVFTSEERWRRWQQRAHDNDARFMRTVRRMFWSGLVAMTVVLVIFLLS
jgi:hypothetical protein